MAYEDDLIAITARLTAHEFILEVFAANITADWPDDNVAQFWEHMTTRPPYLARGPVDVEAMEAQNAQYQLIIENFAQKAKNRRDEVIQGRNAQR